MDQRNLETFFTYRTLGLFARKIVITGILVFITGCASGFTTLAPNPPEASQKLGPASGKACGSMLIGPTIYNFIPIMLDSRMERAYQSALNEVPGSTALVNVTMHEDWYWWVIGTTRCVTITGEAIR
jgi:hypothetical protein